MRSFRALELPYDSRIDNTFIITMIHDVPRNSLHTVCCTRKCQISIKMTSHGRKTSSEWKRYMTLSSFMLKYFSKDVLIIDHYTKRIYLCICEYPCMHLH